MPGKPEPLGNYMATWGEGPIWWEDYLLYVDIEDHKVIRFEPDRNEETLWDAGERVGTVVPRASGGFVIAGDNGFAFLDPATSAKTPIADPEPDKKPDNRFNDGKCDPSGRFWAGTISTVKKAGDAKLYMLDLAGQVHEKFASVTNSNGICWNSDATRMYYIDTPRKQILEFDFDNATGEIGEPRTLADTAAQGFESSPDGMTIDSQGNLWVAMCHGGLVLAFDPSTGAVLERIEFPCVETTAPAFGGPDLKTLYVTTGLKPGLDEPNAGRVFAVDMEVAGVPGFAYQG